MTTRTALVTLIFVLTRHLLSPASCLPAKKLGEVPVVVDRDGPIDGPDFLSLFLNTPDVRSQPQETTTTLDDAEGTSNTLRAESPNVTDGTTQEIPNTTPSGLGDIQTITPPVISNDLNDQKFAESRVVSVRISTSVNKGPAIPSFHRSITVKPSITTVKSSTVTLTSKEQRPIQGAEKDIFTTFLDAFAETSNPSTVLTENDVIKPSEDELSVLTSTMQKSKKQEREDDEEEVSLVQEEPRVTAAEIRRSQFNVEESSPVPLNPHWFSASSAKPMHRSSYTRRIPVGYEVSVSHQAPQEYKEEPLSSVDVPSSKSHQRVEFFRPQLRSEPLQAQLSQTPKPADYSQHPGQNYQVSVSYQQNQDSTIKHDVPRPALPPLGAINQGFPNRQFAGRNYQKPEMNYEVPVANFERPEVNYGVPVPNGEKPIRNEEPVEQNYEVPESVSAMTRGKAHGVQPSEPGMFEVFDKDLAKHKESAANQKFGYVVEGRNYRKYMVEEKTSDGFIVGEYGVVNHDDGQLRGVRYTADGTINPKLIYDALAKFLSL